MAKFVIDLTLRQRIVYTLHTVFERERYVRSSKLALEIEFLVAPLKPCYFGLNLQISKTDS